MDAIALLIAATLSSGTVLAFAALGLLVNERGEREHGAGTQRGGDQQGDGVHQACPSAVEEAAVDAGAAGACAGFQRMR